MSPQSDPTGDAPGSRAQLRVVPNVEAGEGTATKGPVSTGAKRADDSSLHLARHLADRPGFCPNCGAAYDERGLVVEYWTTRQRVFHCWCGSCRHAVEITDATIVITEEPEH
jgi:hypothetical protein